MFANRTGWFALPYVTKHNNAMSLKVIYCQINKNVAMVYGRFIFHASIASKLTTDKPTCGHAARRPTLYIVPPMPACSIHPR